MTDEQAWQFYEELQQMFGDKLANPEHYPLTFAYQVKLFKYYKGLL